MIKNLRGFTCCVASLCEAVIRYDGRKAVNLAVVGDLQGRAVLTGLIRRAVRFGVRKSRTIYNYLQQKGIKANRK